MKETVILLKSMWFDIRNKKIIRNFLGVNSYKSFVVLPT
jgi:hypothetical protein